MGGSSTSNQAGVYGTQGVAAPGNVPGSRRYATSWTDPSGNFWLFGGDGYDSTGKEVLLNDLWEFNPSINEWTWVGGASVVPCTPTSCIGVWGVYGTLETPAAADWPGSRNGATGWTDKSGNLWLFGGDGADGAGNEAFLNDVWVFNPTTTMWTWMGGSDVVTCVMELGGYCTASSNYGNEGTAASGNIPGGRFGAVGWTGSDGSLWLFGGETIVTAGADTMLNDLWEFDPSTNEWEWVGGTAAAPCPVGVSCSGVSGVYGSPSVPDPANVPGGRYFPGSWTDSSGNFWLFGGEGMVANGGNILSDLWEYSPTTREWTWMGGSDTLMQAGGSPGVYGVEGTPAAANIPGSRWVATSWMDVTGDFWLLGGWGYDSNGSVGYLNDLWMFSPETNEWTWMSGSSLIQCPPDTDPSLESACGEEAVYGTKGEASPQSVPGGRELALGWSDREGHQWIFGGIGNSAGRAGHLNDVWKYQPVTGKIAQTITFAPLKSDLKYGAKPVTLTARTTSGLTAIFSVLSGPGKVSGAVLTINGAGMLVLAANQPGNVKYAHAAQVTQTVEIKKAPLTLAAKDEKKIYGTGHPPFSYTAAGFVNGDTAQGVLHGSPSLSTTATIHSPVGQYPITIAAGSLSARNYSFQYVAGVLLVEKAKLGVTADSYTIPEGSAIPKLGYKMTGFVNGDTERSATSGLPALRTTATSSAKPGTYSIKITGGTLAAKNYSFTFADGTLTIQ